MLYKPSKKEIKKIKNLNKAYSLIKEGMELIRSNIKKDIDTDLFFHRICKNLDKLSKRIHKNLEKQYINTEFIHIINSKDKS